MRDPADGAGRKVRMLLTRSIEVLLLGISFFAVFRFFAACGVSDLLLMRCFGEPADFFRLLFFSAAAALGAEFALWRLPRGTVLRAWWPWIGFLPLLGREQPDLWSAGALIPLCGWSVFRLACASDGPRRVLVSAGRLPERFWILLLLLVTLVFVAGGLWFYREALNRLWFYWEDWGIFNEVAWNTLRGRWLVSDLHGGENFFGDHFMPGFFVWFIPLLAATGSAMTLPVLGAFFLWGSAPLIYYLARLKGVRPPEAFGCALIFLFYPMITNLNLSGFYGAHVIYFFIPVLILYYCFDAKGMYKSALAVFLFSLTIKESVALFWCGWACCALFAGRNRRRSALMLAAALGYFIAVTQGIIPAISGGYRYSEYYAGLGSSLPGIALSPLLRPGVFWPLLFTERNLLLIALLLAPVAPAVLRQWKWLPAALLLPAVNMLRGNPEMVNLAMHHTAECVAFLLVLTVLGIAEGGGSGGWDRLLLCGLRTRPGRIRPALVIGVLAGTLLAYSIYAQGWWGSAAWSRTVGRLGDLSPMFDEVKARIPAGVPVASDHRSMTFLMLRNPIAPIEGLPEEIGTDYALYELSGTDGTLEFHRKLVKDPDWGVLWMERRDGRMFYLFGRGAPRREPPRRRLAPEEFDRLPGREIRLNEDFLRVKLATPQGVSGGAPLMFSVLMRKPAERHCRFFLKLNRGGETAYFTVPYGWNFRFADEAEPGELFEFTLPVPPHWDALSGLNFSIGN